jgi:hypothetical protein
MSFLNHKTSLIEILEAEVAQRWTLRNSLQEKKNETN